MMPAYGESNSQGFFLTGGGYYWAMNKYVDLYLLGDIYSRGSWAVNPKMKYIYRYHYSGAFDIKYGVSRTGAADSPDFSKSTDFHIQWSHAQDAKARPHSTFSASVNIISENFNKTNAITSVPSYLSNTFQSSINYTTNWNDNYNLTLNISHSQNTLTKTIDISGPSLSFGVNQFYLFRKKNHVGKLHWYENISTKYSLDAANQYSTTDSLIFKKKWWNDLKYGIKHSVPISATFHVLKYFNWTNSITLNDRMYFSTIRKRYVPLANQVTHKDTLLIDTVRQFANAFDGSASTSLNTRLYGMYQFKHGPIVAIRHMVSPTLSFTYSPNFGSAAWGYSRYATNDTNKNPQKYSIFEQGLYGGPATQKSGLLAFSISNNLEMKVKSKKDTVTGTKKIVLIENLTLNETYDITKDTNQWSNFTIQGYTTLFKNLRVTYGGAWDPYVRDTSGRDTKKTELEVNHRLLRLDNTLWDLGLTYSLTSDKSKKKKTTTKGTEQERKDINDNYDYYIDFDIPWKFSLAYKFTYQKVPEKFIGDIRRVGSITQTLGFNGELNITPKWKITMTSGWDFTNGQLSFTSIDLYRDLHCWEMRFGWIPKGAQQSWNFSINVKASVLQDLKLDKKKDFRDFAQ
jgi:hypothetical protein